MEPIAAMRVSRSRSWRQRYRGILRRQNAGCAVQEGAGEMGHEKRGWAEGKAVLNHLAVDHPVDRLQLEPALCGAVSPLPFQANNSDPHLLEVRRLHRIATETGGREQPAPRL